MPRTTLLLTALLLSMPAGIAAQVSPVIVQTEYKTVRTPLFEFSMARGKFADAIEEFRKGLSSDKDRKKAAKQIEKNVDTFIRYIRTVSHDRPAFDPADLKAFTAAELATETLRLAQQVRPELRRVVRNERSAVVPVSYWEFLYKLETDLVRLKWTSSQLR